MDCTTGDSISDMVWLMSVRFLLNFEKTGDFMKQMKTEGKEMPVSARSCVFNGKIAKVDRNLAFYCNCGKGRMDLLISAVMKK